MSPTAGYPAAKLVSNRSRVLKHCERCPKKFRSPRPGQRFCSTRCQQANYLAGNLEKIRAYKKAWNALNRPRKQPKLKTCEGPECSKTFETSDPQKRFCSEKCRDADHYKRHRPRYLAYTRKWRRANPEKCRQQCRRYYSKHSGAENTKSRRRYAESVAERARLRNVEGLELKIGLRASLIAHRLEKHTLYAMAPDIYPESSDPHNAVKTFVRRFGAIIESEKERISKLPEELRKAEAADLANRLRRELKI